MYVFDATTAAYVGAATMGPGAAYSISLAAGDYKAYIQTNTPAYPDQYYGGSTFARPRPPSRSAPTPARTSLLVSPPTFTLSGNVTTSGGTAQRDLRVRLRRDHRGLRRGGHDGPRRGLQHQPRRRATTRPTSRPTRRPTPTSTTAARASRPRPRSRSAPTPARTSLLVSPPTFTLSGNVTTSGGPLSGTLRVRLRRDHRGLRRGGHDGPRRGLQHQPRGGQLQGLHPDQHAGLPRPVLRRLEPRQTATTITVSANTTQDSSSLASPPTFTLSGNVTTSGGHRSAGPRVRLRRDHRGLRRGGHDGPRRGLQHQPRRGQLQGLHPDQHAGLPRPVLRRLEPRQTATTITVSANTTQDLAPGQPADVHPERHRDDQRRAPLSGTFVYVFDATTAAYVGAATMGPGAAYSINLAAGNYKPYIQTNTPAYPDQYYGGSSFATARPRSRSAPTPARTSLLASPPTFTLTRRRDRPAAAPFSGTFVYVFDATTAAYVSNDHRWAPARPTASACPTGNYKAYIQTNTPAYTRPLATAVPTASPTTPIDGHRQLQHRDRPR